MALSAIEVRALQALRAPGGMTAEQAWERWPTTGTKALHELVRKGFAADVDERFLITKSGRAACPPVNPLLAAVPAKPKETAMLMNCHSYKDVVAAIADAGPSGLTRKQLADRFAADSRADLTRIDAHVFYALTKVAPPPIAKIKPGHYVAAEFAPEPETVETKLRAAIERIATPAAPEVPESEVAKRASDYAGMIDFDLEEAQSVDVTAATPNVALATPDVAALEARYHALRAEVGGLLDAISTAVGIKDAAEARVKELERLLHAFENGARYAVAFESDFHDSIESAVRRASECYDKDSLSTAIVISCTPLGSIDMRWAFVPRGAA